MAEYEQIVLHSAKVALKNLKSTFEDKELGDIATKLLKLISKMEVQQ